MPFARYQSWLASEFEHVLLPKRLRGKAGCTIFLILKVLAEWMCWVCPRGAGSSLNSSFFDDILYLVIVWGASLF